MSQPARQHESRESQRLGLWVGLSMVAHVMALLLVGVVSRTCGIAASPGRTASKGVVTLEVSPQRDGPVGKTTRHTRDVRTEPGPVVDRGCVLRAHKVVARDAGCLIDHRGGRSASGVQSGDVPESGPAPNCGRTLQDR